MSARVRLRVTVPGRRPSWLVRRPELRLPHHSLLFNVIRRLLSEDRFLNLTLWTLSLFSFPLLVAPAALEAGFLQNGGGLRRFAASSSHSSPASVASAGCSGFGFILEVFFFFSPSFLHVVLASWPPFLSALPHPSPRGCCCGGAGAGLGGFTFQPRRYANPPSCRQINWGGLPGLGTLGRAGFLLVWAGICVRLSNFICCKIPTSCFFFSFLSLAQAAFWERLSRFQQKQLSAHYVFF